MLPRFRHRDKRACRGEVRPPQGVRSRRHRCGLPAAGAAARRPVRPGARRAV